MPLEYQSILNSFNKIAEKYQDNAVLQKEVLYRMSERLQLESFTSVSHVLDLACGTGWASEYLLPHFKEAELFALDFSEEMLKQVPDNPRIHKLHNDMHSLPFDDRYFDVVFSNMSLHWSNEPEVFKESLRVLKPGGLLLMSCLGETSLFELKESCQSVNQKPRVHSFPALHSLGDELVKAGFHDVVVNAEVINLTYKDLKTLMQDIKASGGQNAFDNRAKGLMTKQEFEKLVSAYEEYRDEGRLPASYEVVYLRAIRPKAEENSIALTIK